MDWRDFIEKQSALLERLKACRELNRDDSPEMRQAIEKGETALEYHRIRGEAPDPEEIAWLEHKERLVAEIETSYAPTPRA